MSNSRNVNVVTSRQSEEVDYETSVSWDDWHITIHVHPGYDYDIDLMRAQSARDICNWLGQIAEKSWSSTELLGKLVLAFTYAVGDLRGLK